MKGTKRGKSATMRGRKNEKKRGKQGRRKWKKSEKQITEETRGSKQRKMVVKANSTQIIVCPQDNGGRRDGGEEHRGLKIWLFVQ